jgi:light-regulated signal transduction histidine kinase (bacteriophytochrome)
MISFNPIQNDKEECIGVACYSKDISDRMKYINAIERQNEKLKSIAWTQSHVVRAPLSRLMGLINIIKMGAIEKNELDEYLGHLKDAAKELDQVIHDIVEKTKEVGSNGGAENMDDRR